MTRKLKRAGLLFPLGLILLLACVACSDPADDGDEGGGGGGIDVDLKPRIEIRPDSPGGLYEVNLGEVPVGTDHDIDLEVYNTGEAVLTIERIVFNYTAEDPDAEGNQPAFTCTYGPDNLSCDDPTGLPMEIRVENQASDLPAELPIYVRFHRHDDSLERQATLAIESDDKERGTQYLQFRTGESIARIQVTPPRVTFEGVKKGEVDTKFYSIISAGTEDLVIDRFTLAANPHFTVVFNGQEYVSDEQTRAGIDIDPPIELGPNENLDVEIRFAPETADGAEGTMQLRSNDPDAEWSVVYIEAIQSGPVIGLNPTRVEFGPRVVGREAALQLQVLSRGTEDLIIDQLEFAADASSPDFAIDLTQLRPTGEPITADNPLIIPPNDFVTLDLYYTPDVVNDVDELTGEPVLDTGLLLIGNNSFEELVEVEASGYGVMQDCPQAVILCEEGDEVIPQTTLHLVGDQSYAMAGEVRKWEWRVDQPVGSQSVFVPSPTFPNPTFEVNVAGTYTFYLDVWDQENVKSCEPATYEVVVIPDEAIHIELLWTTPGDPDETDTGPFAGSDVDLHFIHPNAPSDPNAPDLDGDGTPDPYFDQPYDSYWFNPHPDWGAFGDEFDDDPGLDRDDTDGAGPENVNLNVPENGKQYQVAVHYWNDHGYGASFVTVRVYIYQAQVFELANVRLINYDLWCVAFVDWPSGSVSLCEAPDGGYRITSNYQHPMFFD